MEGRDLPDPEASARQLLERVLGAGQPPLLSDAPLASLPNWDSLKYLQLVLEIETELGAPLAPEAVESLVYVADVERVLARTWPSASR
jgi:acyl carrier protein